MPDFPVVFHNHAGDSGTELDVEAVVPGEHDEPNMKCVLYLTIYCNHQ